MQEIEKALQELARAVETVEPMARITVSITLVKPKPSKDKPDK